MISTGWERLPPPGGGGGGVNDDDNDDGQGALKAARTCSRSEISTRRKSTSLTKPVVRSGRAGARMSRTLICFGCSPRSSKWRTIQPPRKPACDEFWREGGVASRLVALNFSCQSTACWLNVPRRRRCIFFPSLVGGTILSLTSSSQRLRLL